MDNQYQVNKPSARQRRVSSVTISSSNASGGSENIKNNEHNALRRTKTVDVVANPVQIRTDKIRHQVIGFLGRKLTVEEEEILHKDCDQVSSSDTDSRTDQQVASRVVQSLFAAYSNHNSQEEENQQARSSSIQLEAEAVQVETMAILKIQASARGYLRRQWLTNSTTRSARQLAKETAQKWMEQHHFYTSKEHVDAVIKIQASARGYLTRNQTKTPINNTPQEEKDDGTQNPQTNNRPSPCKAESIRLDHLSENTQSASEASSSPTMDSETDDSGRTNTSYQDMQLWSTSQQQLSHLTENVKEAIVIKVQAHARGFLFRRRRRRQLRKEQSLRMLCPSRPTLMQVIQGSSQEHQAAIKIQRIFRGFVQRWKYWYAMRQQQLDEILSLRDKQLRKIKERKKAVLKTTKTQVSFDATSLARQLQRAKRVIKFLVKEEKRQIQQNERLSMDLKDFAAQNQQLEHSNQTTSDSVETLQTEVDKLQSQNEKLQSSKDDLETMIQQLRTGLTAVNEKVDGESKRKSQVVDCIERVKVRAHEFLLNECPEMLEKF